MDFFDFHLAMFERDLAHASWEKETMIKKYQDWYYIRYADNKSNVLKDSDFKEVIDLYKRYIRIKKEKHAFSIKDLDIDGDDIKKELNIKQGKLVGDILKHLFELVLDGHIENENSCLINIANSYIKKG